MRAGLEEAEPEVEGPAWGWQSQKSRPYYPVCARRDKRGNVALADGTDEAWWQMGCSGLLGGSLGHSHIPRWEWWPHSPKSGTHGWGRRRRWGERVSYILATSKIACGTSKQSCLVSGWYVGVWAPGRCWFLTEEGWIRLLSLQTFNKHCFEKLINDYRALGKQNDVAM